MTLARNDIQEILCLFCCNLFCKPRLSPMKDEKQTAKSAEREKDPMTNSLPDEDLMFHVRNGVGESLGELFSRYQDPLFNFYCRLTGDRAISEDLVQDV